MTDLAARPRDPVVGTATPHESALQHATGAAVYTDDLAPSTAHVLTAWPVQSAHTHALVTLDAAPTVLGTFPGYKIEALECLPGTGDALLSAEAFAAGDEFLMTNSDNYYPVSALRTLVRMGRPGTVFFTPEGLAANSNIEPARIAARGNVASLPKCDDCSSHEQQASHSELDALLRPARDHCARDLLGLLEVDPRQRVDHLGGEPGPVGVANREHPVGIRDLEQTGALRVVEL